MSFQMIRRSARFEIVWQNQYIPTALSVADKLDIAKFYSRIKVPLHQNPEGGSVEEAIRKKGVRISGHVIFNQCGTVLTRKNARSVEVAYRNRIHSIFVQRALSNLFLYFIQKALSRNILQHGI